MIALHTPASGRASSGGGTKAPFDAHELELWYRGGSFTSNRVISFGEEKDGGPMDTGNSISITPLGQEPFTNGLRCTEVVACYGTFSTQVMGSRSANLHKSGSSEASEVWVAIPTGVISPVLVKKLHQGGVDQIAITTLAMIAADDAGTPSAVQTILYTSCFITYVDIISSIYLTIFAFTFVVVKIVQLCATQTSENGANATGSGNIVWEYDYSASKTPGGGK
jgi:hypothetical protein